MLLEKKRSKTKQHNRNWKEKKAKTKACFCKIDTLSSRCFILIQFKWAPSTADEPGAGNIEFPGWFRVLWNCKDACSNIIEKLSFIQDCCPFHFAPEPVTPLHQMMLLSLLNRTLMQPLSLQTPHSWCLVTAVDKLYFILVSLFSHAYHSRHTICHSCCGHPEKHMYMYISS